MAQPGKARGCFLSRWPIHKTLLRLLQMALATAHFSPAQGFISLRVGVGEALSAKEVEGVSLSQLHRVYTHLAPLMDGLGLAGLHIQL